jgi:hypothetical protein
LVYQVAHLQRAEQESVPHILDGDSDLAPLGFGRQLLQGVASALVGDIVGHLRRHHPRHDQDRVHAQRLRQPQLLTAQLQRLRTHLRVRVRERLLPVDACRERTQLNANRIGVATDLLRVCIAGCRVERALEVHVELDRVEARLLDYTQASLHIPVAWQRPAVDANLEGWHRRVVRQQSGNSCRDVW